MYLILVIEAIFTPRKLSRRIKCKHEDLKEHMVDAGMGKRHWCLDCGGFWVSDGIAV